MELFGWLNYVNMESLVVYTCVSIVSVLTEILAGKDIFCGSRNTYKGWLDPKWCDSHDRCCTDFYSNNQCCDSGDSGWDFDEDDYSFAYRIPAM